MENTNKEYSVPTKLNPSELKAQIDRHLEGKPESWRSYSRVMKALELIAFVIMILVFITALSLSFLWKSIPTQSIPTAWFLLPTSAALLTMLIGIHSIIIKAFPPSSFLGVFKNGSPIRLPSAKSGFVTGDQARGTGWTMLIVGLIMGAFFAVFAWASWTMNWILLTPMITVLAVVLGIGIAASIVVKMASTLFKTIKR